MQLICLACSSFKKVFKASISDLRSPVEALERATEEAEAVESVERGIFKSFVQFHSRLSSYVPPIGAPKGLLLCYQIRIRDLDLVKCMRAM